MSILENIQNAFAQMTWVEIWAVIAGLIYVILAARENIWCWSFGIANSILSIYLFYTGQLYAESFLYVYYVIAGFYGWYAWRLRAKIPEGFDLIDSQEEKIEVLNIHTWKWSTHLMTISLGILLSFLLAYFLKNFTDAKIPTLDAFTTVFSFIATYMVTRKVLENWIYWILIDLVTTGMYYYRGYYLYAILMIVYTIIAVAGFQRWNDQRKKNSRSPKERPSKLDSRI